MGCINRNEQLPFIDPEAVKSFIAASPVGKAKLRVVCASVGFFDIAGEYESRHSFPMEQVTRAIGATIK